MPRRLLNGDGAIVSCGGDEGLLLDRDDVVFLREACEAKRSPDVWQCLARLKKGKSSTDGVTAEMLLALPEEQIVCLARNIQNMFSSLNLPGDMVSGHGVSHSQKATSERSQRVSSHQLPDTFRKLQKKPSSPLPKNTPSQPFLPKKTPSSKSTPSTSSKKKHTHHPTQKTPPPSTPRKNTPLAVISWKSRHKL